MCHWAVEGVETKLIETKPIIWISYDTSRQGLLLCKRSALVLDVVFVRVWSARGEVNEERAELDNYPSFSTG